MHDSQTNQAGRCFALAHCLPAQELQALQRLLRAAARRRHYPLGCCQSVEWCRPADLLCRIKHVLHLLRRHRT